MPRTVNNLFTTHGKDVLSSGAERVKLNPTTPRVRPTDADPRGPPRRLLTPHGLARWPPDGSRGPSECE